MLVVSLTSPQPQGLLLQRRNAGFDIRGDGIDRPNVFTSSLRCFFRFGHGIQKGPSNCIVAAPSCQNMFCSNHFRGLREKSCAT